MARLAKGVAALLIAVLAIAPAQAARIPWNDNITYARTSVDEDVKDVLRGALRANGFSVVFQGTVAGKVNGNFEDTTPRDVFERLTSQFGLSYEFDGPAKIVTVYSEDSADARNAGRSFVALSNVSYNELTSVLDDFGIGSSGLSYDPSTRLLSISGSPSRVKQVTDLVTTMERQAGPAVTNVTGALQPGGPPPAAAYQDDTPIDVANASVKVIPLRFAEVGQTTKTFQGDEVTVPGITETLESLLGRSAMTPADRRAFAAEHDGAQPARNSPMALFREGRISIDRRTNSVVVWGSPRFIAEVERLIAALDKPQPMVLIEVIIARAEVGTAEELGVAWRGSLLKAGGEPKSGAIDTGTSIPQVTGDAANRFSSNGLDAISLLPTTTTAGGTLASFVFRGSDGFLQAQLKALSDDNKANVLSAPRLVTMDNTTARISRSQNIFVKVDTGSNSANGVGLSEVKTGLALEITPAIIPARTDGEDALIRLNINAENSAPGSGIFGQIDVVSQQVQTSVLVPDGSTYVVGGLFDDTKEAREVGVPGLKRLWGVGRLFRDNTSSNRVGETVFFITPRVIDQSLVADSDVAIDMTSTEYLSRQRQRLQGARDELLGTSGSRIPNIRLQEEDE